MRRHGFLAIIFAGAATSAVWLLNLHHSVDASEEPTGSFREAYRDRSELPEPVQDDGGIRLNYFDAGWASVLGDVAKQSGLTLVMDRVPHGSFARRDRNRYQLESAIQILNADLEPQGFRLLIQQQFLIVLKLDQARTRYARPVLNDWKSVDSKVADSDNAPRNAQDSPFQMASARRAQDAPRVAWTTQENSPANDVEAVENSVPQPPRPAAPFAQRLAPEPRPTLQAEQPVEEGPAILKTVKVQHAKASHIARSIYLVFESRAELVSQGLQDLPTVVVRRSENTATKGDASATVLDKSEPPLFRMAINQQQNELVIEASAARTTHLTKLVNELDQPVAEDSSTVRLIPSKGVSEVTAKDLNEQIHRMVALQQQQQQQAPVVPNQPPGQQQPQEAPEGASVNLRGEVNVQAMQDLGILILRGNEADVQKVEAIIKQLEEMSVGALPDIHLLSLQHVNSEAMAELMTSVYEKLAELRNRGGNQQQTAAFIPVVQPNALLIIAPAIELEAILELAGELDQRTDPAAEFQVFSLQNAIAAQVAQAVEDFYDERGGLGTRLRVIADPRTNSIIVQGRENDLKEVARLVQKFDRAEPGAVHRVEIVELKHATAEELAATINTAIQSVSSPPQQNQTGGLGGFGANQAAQELRDAKSAALEFLATTGGARELIRSGILVDVRISADPRTNSLIISAPEVSMSLLTALVRQLDQPPSAIAEIKVFALRNADAEQSVELLTTLFENQNQEDQLGVQIAGTEGAPSSLIPVQFSADARTNTVLAVGGAESLSVVEAILLRLDTAEARERRTVVIPMRNVQATIVAAALDSFLEQQQELQTSTEGLVSNIERLRQEVIIAPDDNSNSLIVSASPEYFSEISQIITELDANPPQVIIQALLVEVQLNNTDEFGVELGFQDPLLFQRSLVDNLQTVTTTIFDQNGIPQSNSQTIVSANGAPGFNFNNTSQGLGNNVSGLLPGQTGGVNTSTVAGQGISNFSLGRQNSELGFGGFVFSAQSDAVSVLVRALAARRTVHVLSRPQIRTTHNNVASIQVGQQVPVVNGVTVTDNFVTPQIIQQDVGIILRVTPRVTPDGTISMEVYAEKSSLAPGGVPVFTDSTTGNVVESVIIDSAIADTTVSVPNGQTIVIGGMITKSDETLERKVPWLGDLPLVGNLFRYDGTTTARTELLIFLTPRIIYSDADSELIKQVESERMHFIESEAEEIHGPLFSVPQSESNHILLPEYQMHDHPLQMSPEQPYGNPAPHLPPVSETMLPPQSAGSPDGAQKPDANFQAKNGAAASGSTGTPATSSVPMQQALSTTTLADNGTGDDNGAAEWVRQVLQSKQLREQQSGTSLEPADAGPVIAESTVQPFRTGEAQTEASTGERQTAAASGQRVTQAGGQRPSAEPIQTLSATTSDSNPRVSDEIPAAGQSSWMKRLLKPRKQSK